MKRRITIEKYKKAFSLFVIDKPRNYFNKPFRQGDKYFATDRYVMIFLPVKEANLGYKCYDEELPDCSVCIPKELTPTVKINYFEIKKALDEKNDKMVTLKDITYEHEHIKKLFDVCNIFKVKEISQIRAKHAGTNYFLVGKTGILIMSKDEGKIQ